MKQTKAQLFSTLKVFIGHYYSSPFQAGAILLGIILAVSLFTSIKVTNENAVNSYQEETELLSSQANATLYPPDGKQYLSEQQYFKLRRAGVPSLAVLSGYAFTPEHQYFKIYGSDLIAAFTIANRHKKAGKTNQLTNEKLPLARLLSGENIVLMGKSFAEQYAPTGQFVLNDQLFDVVTMADNENLGRHILMDISAAQRLLGKPELLSYIALFSPFKQLKFQLTEQQLIIDNNQLQEFDKGVELTNLTRSFHFNLQSISMLAYLVGLFIAYNGIRYSLIKRQKLLIKLMQFGVSRNILMGSLFIELSFLVIIGGCLGFVFGLQVSHWLQPMVQMTLEKLYFANLLPGKWQLIWLMEVIGLTLLVAMAACFPIYRFLVRQSLAQNLIQIKQNTGYKQYFVWQCSIGGIGLIVSYYVLSQFEIYELTMIFTGVLLISFALFIPLLLYLLLIVLEKTFKGALNQYLVADCRELIAPLSLAMIALFIALSSGIAMSTMTASFNKTMINWLESTLDGDLYIYFGHRNPETITAVLNQDPNVERVRYTKEIKARYLPKNGVSQRVTISSRDNNAVTEYTNFKQVELGYLESFFRGESIFISEPMAHNNGLKLGDKVIISALIPLFPKGIPISAIYYDYRSPYGQVIISDKVLQQLGLSGAKYNIVVNYQGNTDKLVKRLFEQTKLPANAIYSVQQRKKFASEGINRTFAITEVLNSLTLFVAAIGLFSAYMVIIKSRETNIARLYALGVTKFNLFMLIGLQMLLFLLLVITVSVPVGMLLGKILATKVMLESFGWSINIIWPWWLFLKASLITFIAACIALGYPLYRQSSKPLIASLQREIL